ncbi:hypothetical protein E2C01_069787 [Portunus trituberculatus]|uniref:Uncharacterized protein n=1 Tax=Portunus trituberculatus TaxID=210409 RepID=A0A5B7HSG8_PORTR|nr:hypothetical protein [Portunus trituberculatus]
MNTCLAILILFLSNPTKRTGQKEEKGTKLFSQIIPSYNINVEEFRQVTQCYKCYQFTHRTNQCKDTEQIYSKYATKGHNHKDCESTNLKCINRDGGTCCCFIQVPN